MMGFFRLRTPQEKLDQRLINAIHMGTISEVRKLIDLGAEVNAKDASGAPALICAIAEEHSDIALFLIRNHARLDCQDKKGNAPLHWAVSSKMDDVIEKLIQAKAPINQQNKENYSPLHFSAANGMYWVSMLLLDAGANSRLRTIHGDTPADLARDGKYDGLARTIEKRTLSDVTTGWRVTSEKDKEIINVTLKRDAGYRVTEMFNFKARKYTNISCNLETGAESSSFKMFDDFTDKTMLEEAFREIASRGIKVNREAIYRPPHDNSRDL